jgi:hypothetical protein
MRTRALVETRAAQAAVRRLWTSSARWAEDEQESEQHLQNGANILEHIVRFDRSTTDSTHRSALSASTPNKKRKAQTEISFCSRFLLASLDRASAKDSIIFALGGVSFWQGVVLSMRWTWALCACNLYFTL